MEPPAHLQFPSLPCSARLEMLPERLCGRWLHSQNGHPDGITCGGSPARGRILSSLRWAGLGVPAYPGSRAGDRHPPAEGVTLRLTFEVPS